MFGDYLGGTRESPDGRVIFGQGLRSMRSHCIHGHSPHRIDII
jgi:hypothetical protein